MLNPLAKKLAGIGRRNVTRNWRHSLASSLAIMAGFTAVSLFDGFLNDLRRVNEQGYSLRGMQGDLIIQRKDAQHKLVEDAYAYSLTKDEQVRIEGLLSADPDFDLRVRMLEVKGMIANGRNNAIIIGMAYDVAEGLNMRSRLWGWNTIAGLPFHEAGLSDAILVGTGLGRMMDCVPLVDVSRVMRRGGGYIAENRPFNCDRATLQVSSSTEAAQVNALDLKVVGIVDGGFREQDKHWVTMPLETAQRLLDTDKVTSITVRLKKGANVPAFIERFQKSATALGMTLDVMRWQDHAVGAVMRGSMQILNSFRNLFMVIVVTICVLSVSNTMMKSVSERIREIGALRSFGFKRRDISRMFMFEGLFLALFSCVIGVALTLACSLGINFSGITYRAGILSAPIYLTVALNPVVWMINTLWLTILAAGTAWLAARKAAAMVVADAMRHV